MKLPGMPATKVAIVQKAKREGWRYEEATGIGGTRRMYEVPAKYLVGTSYATSETSKVVGTIAAGSAEVDLNLLKLAMRALDEWEKERGLQVSPERRAVVVNFLYNYLRKGGDAGAMDDFLKAVG